MSPLKYRNINGLLPAGTTLFLASHQDKQSDSGALKLHKDVWQKWQYAMPKMVNGKIAEILKPKNKAAEKQKTQEEKLKNKEVLLRKNQEFLNSLDNFREQTINVLPQPSTNIVEIDNVEVPPAVGNTVLLDMDTTELITNRVAINQFFTAQMLQNNLQNNLPPFSASPVNLPHFSNSNAHLSQFPATNLPVQSKYINSQEHPQPVHNSWPNSWDVQRQPTQMDSICNECHELREELARSKIKIKELEEQLKAYKGESSYQSRKDGRPCAGLVPTETAVANHMVELLPKSGVFVYPKNIKVASKKKSGCAIARHLMSVFYTNQELIDAGNVTGANGKSGLNERIVKAIVDYSIVKSDNRLNEINLTMRSKISALVSKEKKAASED